MIGVSELGHHKPTQWPLSCFRSTVIAEYFGTKRYGQTSIFDISVDRGYMCISQQLIQSQKTNVSVTLYHDEAVHAVKYIIDNHKK